MLYDDHWSSVSVPRLLQTSTGNNKLQAHYIPLLKDGVFDVNSHTPSLLATILMVTDNQERSRQSDTYLKQKHSHFKPISSHWSRHYIVTTTEHKEFLQNNHPIWATQKHRIDFHPLRHIMLGSEFRAWYSDSVQFLIRALLTARKLPWHGLGRSGVPPIPSPVMTCNYVYRRSLSTVNM